MMRKLLRKVLEALLRILETGESSETTGTDAPQKRADADAQAAVPPRLETSATPAMASPEDVGKDGSAASSETATELLLDRVKRTDAMAKVHDKAEDLLWQIQLDTSEGRDTSLLEADVLLLMRDDAAVWRKRIAEAQRQGNEFKRERERLMSVLRTGICSEAMAQYWRELPARAPKFKRKASKEIAWRLRKDLEQAYKKVVWPRRRTYCGELVSFMARR